MASIQMRISLVTLALLFATSCDKPPASQPALPATTMSIGGRPHTVEIARNDKDRTKGLMHRQSLPQDHGMIFVFPDYRPRSFWMKNVPFPLDIIFLKPDGQVVSIHTMKAFDITGTNSAGPAMYAIELNAGVASALGLKPGDVIAIPPEAQKSQD